MQEARNLKWFRSRWDSDISSYWCNVPGSNGNPEDGAGSDRLWPDLCVICLEAEYNSVFVWAYVLLHVVFFAPDELSALPETVRSSDPNFSALIFGKKCLPAAPGEDGRGWRESIYIYMETGSKVEDEKLFASSRTRKLACQFCELSFWNFPNSASISLPLFVFLCFDPWDLMIGGSVARASACSAVRLVVGVKSKLNFESVAVGKG
ncbi:hypothetical protein M569_03782 [Genlisea aurea]|uniref:Uncharacterized protein n=1 Tax=Genlisea aurea TaxID=192259 RepID=S8E5C0_9LAMI|nr:hypothetical protein M569_03782 [Genlisea aurea]